MIDIFIVVLLISASALCIYLIIVLKRLTDSINIMQKDIEKLVTKTLPVLENLNEVSEKALKITNEIESAYLSIQDKFGNLKSNFDGLVSFNKVKNAFSPTEFLTNLKAISIGLITFIKELRK